MRVKYGGSHNSEESKESTETPANRVLCRGNNPASYKRCETYHNIIKGNNTFRNNTQRTPEVNTNIYRNYLQHSVTAQQQRSFADVIKNVGCCRIVSLTITVKHT